MCVLSGLIGGAPILISPESSAGIKAGAKTGLSTFVCGVFFTASLFFAPLFSVVPPAGTSPLLIMIGVVLMQDCNRLNWKSITDAAPAFTVLFFIPFTFSIIHGVILGYIVYILIGLTSGTLYPRILRFIIYYCPMLENTITASRIGYLLDKHDENDLPAQNNQAPSSKPINMDFNRRPVERESEGSDNSAHFRNSRKSSYERNNDRLVDRSVESNNFGIVNLGLNKSEVNVAQREMTIQNESTWGST